MTEARASPGNGQGASGAAHSGGVPGLYAWLRAHPVLVDVALAVALAAISAGEWAGDPAVGIFSLGLAATVTVRRRYPEAAFAVAVMLAVVQVAGGMRPGPGTVPVRALEPTVTDLAIVVLLYTLAASRPRRVSVAALAVCLAGSAAAISRWAPAHTTHPGDALFAAVTGLAGSAVAAWALGDATASRRAYYAAMEDRAARLQAERDAQAQAAAAAERARELQERRARAVDDATARLRRIERDLHDGAQVRLTALAMALGEIKESLDEEDGGSVGEPGGGAGTRTGDPGRIRALVEATHHNAKQALAELRDLARGIHPSVLD